MVALAINSSRVIYKSFDGDEQMAIIYIQPKDILIFFQPKV